MERIKTQRLLGKCQVQFVSAFRPQGPVQTLYLPVPGMPGSSWFVSWFTCVSHASVHNHICPVLQVELMTCCVPFQQDRAGPYCRLRNFLLSSS